MDVVTELISAPYAFHGIIVGAVLVLALLVYVFGFKSAVEPPFDKLSDDRRAAGKKKKVKDKKAQSNGHATAVSDSFSGKKSEVKTPKKEEKREDEKSPSKEQKQKQEKKSPAKNTLKEQQAKSSKDGNKKDDKNKKAKGKGKENVDVVATKNKKNKNVDEKPKDFDDGEWEQAVSRKDKKNRKPALEEILPQKNEKKKDKKKGKEEDEDVKAEPASKISDYKLTPFEIEETIKAVAEVEVEPVKAVEKPATEKIQTVIVETVEAVAEDKPKKKKKKPAPQPPEQPAKAPAQLKSPATPKAEKPVKAPAPPPPAAAAAAAPAVEAPAVESSPPKPPRQEKKKPKDAEPAPVAAAPAPEPEVIEIPAADPSNVAFDELGDAWKEAKAPKKSSKKKTRKD